MQPTAKAVGGIIGPEQAPAGRNSAPRFSDSATARVVPTHPLHERCNRTHDRVSLIALRRMNAGTPLAAESPPAPQPAAQSPAPAPSFHTHPQLPGSRESGSEFARDIPQY